MSEAFSFKDEIYFDCIKILLKINSTNKKYNILNKENIFIMKQNKNLKTPIN